MINMIHNMGGSIRKEMGAKVTHLIANCCGGDKYRYAVTFRVPIMSMEWVTALWNAKDDISSYGNNEELVIIILITIFKYFTVQFLLSIFSNNNGTFNIYNI